MSLVQFPNGLQLDPVAKGSPEALSLSAARCRRHRGGAGADRKALGAGRAHDRLRGAGRARTGHCDIL